jgi:hypothetical protein
MSLADYLAARTGAARPAPVGPADTPDTPAQNLVYQAKPAQILGCTPDTPDTPAERSKQTAPDVCARACATCTHRLPYATCSRPVQAGLRDHFSIVWPDPAHAQSCPAYTARPVTPKTWNHAPATDEELAAMAQRCERFERLGLPYEEAGHLADKLLIRDRDLDGRRACAECHHLRGRPGAWRCPAPGGMPAPLVATLQRCPGFEAAP